MAAKTDDATLYAQQEALGFPARWEERSIATGASAYYAGKMFCFHSRIAAVTGGGAAGDKIQFMKLPKGAVIVGGWLYVENGLGVDGELADLGVYYEDSDGTDDADCLIDGLGVFDGADGVGTVTALPAGTLHIVGSDLEVFPYKVTGGWGTVTLTSLSGDFITNKDVALTLYVIMP